MSKLVADTRRKQRWTATISKGMRGKDHRPRKRRPVKAPAHESNRLKVLSAIKKVRSMSEEEQDRILNSKAELAREADMSYHTLRRSEIQGGWAMEDLITEVALQNKKRAIKK